MIRVSFSLFLSLSVNFHKNYFIIIIVIFIYFHENYFYFFMFRDVPECSMFRLLSTPSIFAYLFRVRSMSNNIVKSEYRTLANS